MWIILILHGLNRIWGRPGAHEVKGRMSKEENGKKKKKKTKSAKKS